jgi:cytidine deaminase
MEKISSELIDAAFRCFSKIPANENHSVVASVLTKDNKIFTAFNVHHFTGGPCAEPAAFGTAAAQGYLPHDLTHVVAVIDKGGKGGVINPCGKCRQIMLDLCPEIQVVIVAEEDEIRIVPCKDLLPYAYYDS